MERAQAEERLQQSEQRLGGILRQATVGVAQTDVTGRFVLVNDRYCEMVGRSREELLGLRMQDITHPEDVPGNLVLFQRTSQTGEDFEIEKRYVRPDGSVVWVHNSVYAVRYASGRPEYIVAMSLDITDRKQAEEVLQQLNLELEQRVAQRTAELLSTVAQREKLQEQLLQAQKMESIGTLAGGIAHDFNNLLNIIMSYTLVIQHNAHQGKLSDALDVIKETVKRAATLVQQLLSIARKTESRFEEINLNTMLEKLQILIRETFPRTIEISLELDFGIPPLRLDQNQVHQVLLNLCVNARDAMPRGGKLLVQTSVIGGHALRQTFHEVKEDRYVCIRVTDTGTGMDERTKSRIFEPFFTTKEPGQGTGLGLSIVYGIVANHGGFIDVESTTGQGTTFSVYLPILPAQVTETHEPAAEGNEAEDFVAEGETILFVDDEEKQLHLMREFLERKGYRVLTARDGIEAVDLHARYKEKIALTILDLGLPKLDGWKAFQRMKQIQPGLSALFATGFLSSKIEAEMKRCQLPGIISKPYRLNDVLEKISVAIREQRTGRWSKELRAKSKT
jgi:two-component system cell cycle sensor histidine kinase/response regulator CckA